MLDMKQVSEWLAGYIEAWKSKDRQAIGELFSQDAEYYPAPYSPVLHGRDAIIEAWLAIDDPPGTFEASYAPVATDGNFAVATGVTRYFEGDGKTTKEEYSNIFLLHFDRDGRCREYREWFMKKPNNR